MSNIKLGFNGHDAQLLHHVPNKWEKRWILFKRWVKTPRAALGFVALLIGIILGLFHA